MMLSRSLKFYQNQAAVNGIRASGATTQLILVEGTSYTGAWSEILPDCQFDRDAHVDAALPQLGRLLATVRRLLRFMIPTTMLQLVRLLRSSVIYFTQCPRNAHQKCTNTSTATVPARHPHACPPLSALNVCRLLLNGCSRPD